MLSFTDWAMYIMTCMLAAGTPGPGTLAVVTSSILYGLKETIALMMGIAFGLGLVSLLTLLGLFQILNESKAVVLILQSAGTAYIVYLGILCFKQAFKTNVENRNSYEPRKWGVISGISLSVLNPKTFLFFMAFFPTYLTKSQAGAQMQLGLILTAVLVTCTFTIHISYSLMVQKLSATLINKEKKINLITGLLFVALGAMMAFEMNW